jgi:type I restriction enzyme M protein
MNVLLVRRRRLRRRATDAEAALWEALRGRQLAGFKFRRQHPCGPFILDFFCAEKQLAIELDGGQHYQPRAQAYDARRTDFLAARGITVLCFPCDQVLREMAGVLVAIAFALGADPSP